MWQRFQIGIDTGVKTGFAIWDRTEKRFLRISTTQIHKAIFEIMTLAKKHPGQLFVRVEDAHLRKWIPRGKTERAEKGRWAGAGSVKRDATIWEDFLTDENIAHEMVAPKHNKTKMAAPEFARHTGWREKTSEHARDAAWLVFQR